MARATLEVDVTTVLTEYLEKQLAEAFEDEFAKAVEIVRERKDEIIAKMAVRIAHQYDIQQNGQTITISVRELK